MLLRVIPDNTTIPFIQQRRWFLAFSGLLLIASLALFFGRGLNLGIDFLGGTLLEVRTSGPADVDAMRAELTSLGLGEVSLQQFGAPDDVLIRVQRQDGGEGAQKAAVEAVQTALGDQVSEYRRVEFVGPTVGAELQEAALLAVLASIAVIAVYIWLRFEWQFGVTAVLALAHDVISVLGLFALFQLEFNLATVAAVLMVAGYSINDTVVVFDRIREMMRKYKTMPYEDMFNLAINSTLSRTFLTSFTTLLALFALLIFGGPVIRDFVIALIWGIGIGTYSSVAVAAALLLYMRPGREDMAGSSDEDEAGEGAAG